MIDTIRHGDIVTITEPLLPRLGTVTGQARYTAYTRKLIWLYEYSSESSAVIDQAKPGRIVAIIWPATKVLKVVRPEVLQAADEFADARCDKYPLDLAPDDSANELTTAYGATVCARELGHDGYCQMVIR